VSANESPSGAPRIGILVAVSPEGVIGLDGKIPWRHSGDMRRFKRLTVGTTVIMGRLTWASLPKKPLPERRNIVLSNQALSDVECFPTLEAALATCSGDVWVIGGARAYAEAMRHAHFLDVTYVPEEVPDSRAVKFPAIDAALFEAGALVPHEDEEGLTRRVYTRR
jgi:dihydrofolate reductase